MEKNLRQSGIDVIGDIFWGTHIGQLYSTTSEFKDVVPFIAAGLNNNELCLWVYSQNTSYDELKSIIHERIEDIDKYLDSGQLMLISHLEWYLKDNRFNEVRVNSQWKEFIRYSLDQNYEGLRAIADTSWLEKSYYRTFAHYEQGMTEMICELPFIVICQYDSNKVDTYEIAEIIKNHSYIITKHENELEVIKNVELLIKDKQLEESLEYNRIITEFFSNISHELRTPISVILSAIQLIEWENNRTSKDTKNYKRLKVMKQNCYRLIRLVDNILDMTKIESNYYVIRKQNYNIVNLIESITMSVVDYALKKNVKIIFDTNIEEKIIACDPDQIERIVLNLLSNAIKFTQNGGKVWVSLIDKGEKVEIIVKDNGIGIPIQKQQVIFNRFEQVDKSIKRICEGSGIGLSLVKALVEKHNGNIAVKSAPGRGSEFLIEIPCEVLNESDNASILHQYPVTRDNVEKINIEFSDICF